MRKSIYILVFSLLSISAVGQYTTELGQNRIQYKSFDWVYYSTTHFDLYYYAGGEDYADQAIEFLEEEFNRLTDLLGYAPYTKTKILIYNSVQELHQSNIGIEGAQFNIGGQTDFVKLQLELAHPGTAVEFKKELIYRLSRVLIEDMLFGGSLAEIFQSAYLLSLPRWFIDGAARYMAYGWDDEMDDHIRDYLSRKRIKKLIKIDGDEAGLVGQSIWNYIALKYGKTNVANVLNLTRIINNEENSISSTVGLPYKRFLKDWQNYYILNQQEIAENFQGPPNSDVVVDTRDNQIKFQNVRISPDGTSIAYSQNIGGRYKIYVKNITTGKVKSVLTSGIRVQGQPIDYKLPLIDWIDNNKVGVVYYKKGYLNLTSIDTKTGDIRVKPLPRFEQIKSFSFNENGKLAMVSGDVDGKNDIYLISMRRNALRRITKDIYDDLDPVFVPGTAAVIFSSNRPNDFVNTEDGEIDDIEDNFNLFLYDLDTTVTKFKRLTNTYSLDSRPIAKNPYEVYYLSDQKGITNIFKYSLRDSTFIQITTLDRGIKDFDIQFDQNKLLYLAYNGGSDKVYLNDSLNLDQPSFTPQTARQRLKQANYIADRYDITSTSFTSEPIQINTEFSQDSITVTTDDTEEILDPDNFQFEGEKESDDGIDTDNYQFSESQDESRNKFRPESFFTNYQRLEVKNEVTGPNKYLPQFGFDNLVTSFATDPLRGFGFLLEARISDMLGNHNFFGGAMISRDRASADVFARYDYLKHLVDFKVEVNRSSYFFDGPLTSSVLDIQPNETDIRQRYIRSSVLAGASIPITNWFRVELNPFFTWTDFTNLQFNSVINRGTGASDNRNNYGGFEAKAVFDNTVERGYNLLKGTRGLVEFDNFIGLGDLKQSFTKARIDIRSYLPLHKELTLATRMFYAQSFGPSKQVFMLGGVPNMLIIAGGDIQPAEITGRIKHHNVNNPLEISDETENENILFGEVVPNLRGFPINQVFGNSTFALSTELKFPIFQYLSKAPINSSFLRNFMIVGFFDFGSAWSGSPPLTRQNSSNTIT